ncbi:unnamed protein product, partial [Ectocarpus sp. 12 AP-2014]
NVAKAPNAHWINPGYSKYYPGTAPTPHPCSITRAYPEPPLLIARRNAAAAAAGETTSGVSGGGSSSGNGPRSNRKR